MMNEDSLDYIVTSKNYSPDHTNRGYLRAQAEGILKARNLRLDIADVPNGPPMKARIYQGSWIADCEYCGGATFVDPEDPVTFCFNCRKYNLRPVEFPPEWREIELTLLQRPVDDIAGLTDNERALLARPIIDVEGKGGLLRNWNPPETLADLHEQQDKPIKAWREAIAKAN